MLLMILAACTCDTLWYIDADEDGWGNSLQAVQSCEAPFGYVNVAGDCLDSDAEIHPDAAERCDNLDNDCDDSIDEEVAELWYRDRDGDGWGSLDEFAEACDPGAGWVAETGDCDDFALAVNPDAVEVCDEVDQDCDDLVDEGATTTYYTDADNDSFGDDDSTVESCSQQADMATEGGDCDDTTSTVNPDATEVCDLVDNNCDGAIDEGVIVTFYADGDSDGYALDDQGDTVEGCTAPSGYTAELGDCDDGDDARSPGDAEVCTDGIDNDCDGLSDCEDGDCATQNGCFEADCTDGIDGDDDGDIDCLDDDCWTESDCVSHAYAQVTDGSYKISDVSRSLTFYGLPFSSASSERITGTSVEGVLKVYGDFGSRSCDWGVGNMSWAQSQSYYGGQQVVGPNRNTFTVSSACPWTSSAFLPSQLKISGSNAVTKTSSLVWYQGTGTWATTSSTYTIYSIFVGRTQSNVFTGNLTSGSDWYWLPN